MIIDPQNDFCHRKGTLYVKGAEKSSKNLSQFIDNNLKKISKIHVTLDSHSQWQIFHALYWRNEKFQSPQPFTTITTQDLESKKWIPRTLKYYDKALKYLENLEKNNQHKLIIWPNHCLIGSWGNLVQKEILQSLQNWEIYNIRNVNFLLKGSYPHSEHYSALKAEVPSNEDPVTYLNSKFITSLTKADTIVIAGQALDFCIFYTLKDLKENLNNKHPKIKLLTNCTNCVEPKNRKSVEKSIENMGIELIDTINMQRGDLTY